MAVAKKKVTKKKPAPKVSYALDVSASVKFAGDDDPWQIKPRKDGRVEVEAPCGEDYTFKENDLKVLCKLILEELPKLRQKIQITP